MTKSITEERLKTLLLERTQWIEQERNSKALIAKVQALIDGACHVLFQEGYFHTDKIHEITITVHSPEPDQIRIEVMAPLIAPGNFSNVEVIRSVIPEYQ